MKSSITKRNGRSGHPSVGGKFRTASAKTCTYSNSTHRPGLSLGNLAIDTSTLLIVLAWATVVVPRLIQSFTASKYRTMVGAPVPLSAPATYFDLVLTVLLVATCLLGILERLDNLPVERRRELLLLLLPWIFIATRDLYVDHQPDRGALLYPIVVITLWALQPQIQKLAVLGNLVGLTALLSISLGLLSPDKGIYTTVSGEFITPEKEILPGGVLIGVFTDSNNLAQFLVLGLPAIALIASRGRRIVLILLTTGAIVWSSSRSSIAAVLVGGIMALLLSTVSAVARRVLAASALLLASLVVILLPLITTDDRAFTNRGAIWHFSLLESVQNRTVGLGSNWYSGLSKYANSLGGYAYHGHNQFVHVITTGGLIYLALVVFMFAMVGIAAVRWAGRECNFPTIFMVVLLISCTLEVSFGFVDREFLLSVSALPVAFIVFGHNEVPFEPPVAGLRRR